MAEEHPATEAAKKQLQIDREASEKSREQFAERMKGKPTPTQEENDLAVLGAPVFEKEDDGSGPDPNINPRHQEARPGGQYQTRHTTAARPATTPTPPRRTE
jgi:hypothetical protein